MFDCRDFLQSVLSSIPSRFWTLTSSLQLVSSGTCLAKCCYRCVLLNQKYHSWSEYFCGLFWSVKSSWYCDSKVNASGWCFELELPKSVFIWRANSWQLISFHWKQYVSWSLHTLVCFDFFCTMLESSMMYFALACRYVFFSHLIWDVFVITTSSIVFRCSLRL